MRNHLPVAAGALLLLTQLLSGCDQLGLGGEAGASHAAPSDSELEKISYMSASTPEGKGRKLYNRLEEARTCGDLELAMRWNRPPDTAGGLFSKKMIYLQSGIPADLPKQSEVFLTARIEKGAALGAGAAGWYLRMPDGTVVQAVETANFLQKEDQSPERGKPVALEKPNKPGRAFCAQGIYQGMAGKDPDQHQPIPLVSVLYAMDREH